MELKIEDDIEDRLSRRATVAGYESTEPYANDLLRAVLDELEKRDNDGVQERLEDLGYL